MQIFVGTSGWSYSWNEGGNFDWFIQNSNLFEFRLICYLKKLKRIFIFIFFPV